MKKINITITGALGRMGKILIKKISKNENLRLLSLIDLKSGKTINNIKVQNNNLEAFKKTEQIIEPTRKEYNEVYISVLDFIKKSRRIVYGGYAQNNLIKIL